jgi:hypothetical protein
MPQLRKKKLERTIEALLGFTVLQSVRTKKSALRYIPKGGLSTVPTADNQSIYVTVSIWEITYESANTKKER